MISRGLLTTLAAGLLAAALWSGTGHAQTDADRRVERLERTVRTLQAAVGQAQATGAPVVVVPEGPNPAVTALQGRLDDMEASRRTMTGELEALTNQLEQVSRARANERSAADAEIKALNDRIARLEAQFANLNAPPPGPDIGLGPPGDLRGGVPAPGDATARAQAGDPGVLGGPAAPVGEAALFRRARELRVAGDYDMAAAAFQDYIARFGTNARAPEAYYNLGELYYLREAYRDATAAFAAALKARPKTTWAADAMVRLAESLQLSAQLPQACAAVEEFNSRYAAGASAAVKKRATSVRAKAKCG